MHRRHFLALGATALGLAQASRAVRAQEIPWGESRLGISDDGRDGTLYVPRNYEDGKPAPLVIMLHGLGGIATRFAFPLAEEFGVVVISPESREITWGQAAPGFDDDVKYIGAAFRKVTALLDIDSKRIALGGVSDGATYALSMGLAYGDTFNHLMIFAAGIPAPVRKRGKPKIFVGHGTEDHQMPIDDTARSWGPKLKAEGYDIIIREHPGGHGAPLPIVREAFQWLVADK